MIILLMCSVLSKPVMRTQFSPPSVVLKRPSPTDTVFLILLSPVPTYIVLGFCWSIARAPIDWQYLSNTDVNDTPALVVFHTPPPAVPTYIVLGSLFTPSIAVIRPPVTAGP